MFKRVELTLKKKIELIKSSSGKSQRHLAKQFGIGKTQAANILKRKAEFLDAYERANSADRKRLKPSNFNSDLQDVDTKVYRWFTQMRAQSIPVSGPMIQSKGLEIAKDLGITFQASSGWLARFKARHLITGCKLSGESGSVPQGAVDEWRERLPTLLQGYSPNNIYNMDETGVFYRALPERSLAVKGSSTSGGKKSKERLTLSLCVNVNGDFERALVIGHAARPRCFKHVNLESLRVTWRSNKKAWMTSSIFEEWLVRFNAKMRAEKCSVILFLDNAPSHPTHYQMSNVKLIFLPPNTTSVLQPLDQGIIQNIKLLYRRKLLEFVLRQCDGETSGTGAQIAKSIDIHRAVDWLNQAMSSLKAETVSKCFKRCGIFPADSDSSTTTVATEIVEEWDAEDDLPLAHLCSRAAASALLEEPLNAREYCDLDKDCPVNDPNQTPGDVESEVEEEEEEEEEATVPSTTDTDVFMMLEKVRAHFLQKGMVDPLTHINLALSDFAREKAEEERRKVQQKITAFFKSV